MLHCEYVYGDSSMMGVRHDDHLHGSDGSTHLNRRAHQKLAKYEVIQAIFDVEINHE